MEATTLYEFSATSGEELSFPAGAVIKIINDEDPNWFKAEYNGQFGYVPSTYIQYIKPTWFMSVTKEEAVKKLQMRNGHSFQHPDGAFIVRPSEKNPDDLSLTARISNDTQHFRILRSPDRHQYYLWNNAPHFNTVNALIAHYRSAPVNRVGHSVLRDVNFPKVHVNYDFQPRSEDELEIRRGEVITVIDNSDENWYEGQVERDNVVYKGHFPVTYVTPI